MGLRKKYDSNKIRKAKILNFFFFTKHAYVTNSRLFLLCGVSAMFSTTFNTFAARTSCVSAYSAYLTLAISKQIKNQLLKAREYLMRTLKTSRMRRCRTGISRRCFSGLFCRFTWKSIGPSPRF